MGVDQWISAVFLGGFLFFALRFSDLVKGILIHIPHTTYHIPRSSTLRSIRKCQGFQVRQHNNTGGRVSLAKRGLVMISCAYIDPPQI